LNMYLTNMYLTNPVVYPKSVSMFNMRGVGCHFRLNIFLPWKINCRDSTSHRVEYWNEWVIDEIQNNPSDIFKNFLFNCCKSWCILDFNVSFSQGCRTSRVVVT
jgi:hypothetical protein